MTLHDGREVGRQVTVPVGDPRRPMTAEDRRRKFLECAEGVLPGPTAAEARRLLERLPALADLEPLMARLRGTARRRRAPGERR